MGFRGRGWHKPVLHEAPGFQASVLLGWRCWVLGAGGGPTGPAFFVFQKDRLCGAAQHRRGEAALPGAGKQAAAEPETRPQAPTALCRAGMWWRKGKEKCTEASCPRNSDLCPLLVTGVSGLLLPVSLPAVPRRSSGPGPPPCDTHPAPGSAAQEWRRYSQPHKAFTFRMHGFESVVGPVKGVFDKETSLNKAREHSLLRSDRPAYVTILSLGTRPGPTPSDPGPPPSPFCPPHPFPPYVTILSLGRLAGPNFLTPPGRKS